MAQSISQAQAKALADGFLDQLGTVEDLQPRESMSTLIQLAGDLVDTAQQNLVSADRVASGALSSSFKILNPDIVNTQIRVDIEALYYYRFVDQGVRGTGGGNGRFAFKNNKVSRAMMIAIRKWVIREGLKARTTRKYSAITKREARRKTIADTSQNTAYAIAVGVKKKGISKSNFFTNAVTTTQTKLRAELGAALKIDVINSIPKNIDGTNNTK